MTIKFQADADLDGRILKALKRAAPEIDIQTATNAGLTGLPRSRRTADRSRGHVESARSPGVILLRGVVPIVPVVDELILISTASEAEEWIDRLVWIPL
jgi:hypothetical protein